jgi:DNA polymerase I
VAVADLSKGDRVYALNPSIGLVKLKLVTDITPVRFEGTLVTISGRSVELHLHPAHQVLYTTKDIADIRHVQAQSLRTREHYRFVNEWTTPERCRLETVDLTDLVAEFEARIRTTMHGHSFRAALPDGCDPSYRNSHSGYHFDPETFKRYQSTIESIVDEVSVRESRGQRTTPYLFDGDDFIELIGWFVTEGSVYWPSEKRTAEISLAQESECHRRRLKSLLRRMEFDVTETAHCFRFSSTLVGRLLETMCGSSSEKKHLLAFV